MKYKTRKRKAGLVQTTIALKPELREKIKAIAVREHRSFSSQTEVFLHMAVSENGTDKEKTT